MLCSTSPPLQIRLQIADFQNNFENDLQGFRGLVKLSGDDFAQIFKLLPAIVRLSA